MERFNIVNTVKSTYGNKAPKRINFKFTIYVVSQN